MNNLDYRDPYIWLTWVAEDAIVAAGHDCRPVLFSGRPSDWQAFGSLDDTTAPKSSVGGRGGATRSSPIGRALVGLLHSIVPLCTLDVYSSPLLARPPSTSGRRCRVLHPRRRPSALSSAPGAVDSAKDPWARRRKTHSYSRHTVQNR
jgi:hypothetical protein